MRFLLGKSYVESAPTKTECSHCENMSLASLCSHFLPPRSMSLAASEAEELSGSTADPAPLPPSEPSDVKHGMDAELLRVLSKAVEELGSEGCPPEEPPHSRLDEWFLPGCCQAPHQRSSPFLPEVHDELTSYFHFLRPHFG